MRILLANLEKSSHNKAFVWAKQAALRLRRMASALEMKNMKLIVLFSLALAFLPGLVDGAEPPTTYETCSQVLIEAEKAGNKISKVQVISIVSAANANCISYAETSEWLNEVLFSTIVIRPKEFMDSFSNADPSSKKLILKELMNPVNDGIDLKKAYNSILSVDSSGKDKQTLLSAVKSAGENAGLKLK